jgi:hypothetical protein
MRILDRHFFSLKFDLIAFTSFIPIYLLHFVASSHFHLPEKPPQIFYVLGWSLADGSHVFSTLFVTYFDKDMRKAIRPWLLGIPVFFVVMNFILHYTGNIWPFFVMLAWLSMIHFIRQEYGWMKIATRFDPDAPAWLTKIDLFSSYGMTILPMLAFTRPSQAGSWFTKGDITGTPEIVGEWALHLCLPVAALFFVTNAWHAWKTRTLNLSKYLVFLNTFFGWYMAKIYVATPYIGVWLVVFHHGIPYFFLVFKNERVTRNVNWLHRLGAYKYLLLYLFCVLLFLSGLYSEYYLKIFNMTPLMQTVVFAFGMTPQIIHFLIDGFVWKKKYGLVKI